MQPTVNDVHIQSLLQGMEVSSEEIQSLIREILRRFGVELLDDDLISKPLPSEHAARQQSPSQYTKFRRRNNEFGQGVHAIYGITAEGKAELQSVRFDAGRFTPEEARAWLREHDLKQSLEPSVSKASRGSSMSNKYCNHCGEQTDDLFLSTTKFAVICKSCRAFETALTKASFTDASWSTPESNLSPEDFCSVCLIDTNPSGQEKKKANCYLPVRSRPGGPYNKGAIRNAAARLNQVKGISSEDRARARMRLASLASQAGIDSKLIEKDLYGESADFTAEVDLIIEKSTAPRRIAYAVVYNNLGPGETDTQSDRFASPDEIEKTAHDFMINSRRYDMHHVITDVPEQDAQVVESYITPQDLVIETPTGSKQIRKGSWIVATKFSPALWQRVLAGEFRGYSIRGRGVRKRVGV